MLDEDSKHFDEGLLMETKHENDASEFVILPIADHRNIIGADCN